MAVSKKEVAFFYLLCISIPPIQEVIMMDLPFVSIIIPCWNEEKFIGKILDDIENQDYTRGKMEILVVDGQSTDGTIAILNNYVQRYNNIRVLENIRQYVPFALNQGIEESKGELIMIMGSHARYPDNYVSTLVDSSIKLNADNVGARCQAVPLDSSSISLAIARALSSPFGMGNSWFRIGTKRIKEVDTVTFGCYRRKVFEKIGLFDESLLRNQDDEFNARLAKSGGKIFLIPDVSIEYYPRSSWKGLFQMFYQYGLFKPLVSRKIGKPTTLRQLVPSLFVLFLLGVLITPFFGGVTSVLFFAGLVAYFLISFLFSFQEVVSLHRVALIFYLPITFLIIHLSYGIGYLIGIIKFIILDKQKSEVSSSR